MKLTVKTLKGTQFESWVLPNDTMKSKASGSSGASSAPCKVIPFGDENRNNRLTY
ncbi:hypothetical protein ACP4OV_001274 [Aristida adscensionis]